MVRRPIFRCLAALVVAAAAAAASTVRADGITDVVATTRAALAARIAAPGVPTKEAELLEKADAALAKFRGVNDLDDVRALGACATAVVKSGTLDAPVLSGVRTIGELCFAEGRADALALEAQRDGLFTPANARKLDRKITAVEGKLARGADLLGEDLRKSFNLLVAAFRGTEVASVLAARLDAVEDKLTALPTGLQLGRTGTSLYLYNTLPGSTFDDRFLFRSVVFTGRTSVDGQLFETVSVSATDDVNFGFDNFTEYGLDGTLTFFISQLYAAAAFRVQQEPGTVRQLQGSFTLRLRRGFSGPFKSYVVPVSLVL